jgi:transposase
MESMYYIGLDVHKKTISYCVKDASGRIHAEGKIPARRFDLDQWMKTLPQPWMVAMEATIFTGWIYDHLRPHAAAVKVAHPLMLRAIAVAKKKSVDANKIADAIRCDFLPECYMAPTKIRERRRTLRYRNLLVRQMVQLKNRISGLLMEAGVSYNKEKLHKVGYFRELLATNPDINEGLKPLLRLCRETVVRLQKTEGALIRSLERDPLLAERVKHLMTIPAVGPITALTWALEVGEVSRFSSIKNAISYCGLCGAEDSSGDHSKRTPISKQRNKHLQWVLVEAAHMAPPLESGIGDAKRPGKTERKRESCDSRGGAQAGGLFSGNRSPPTRLSSSKEGKPSGSVNCCLEKIPEILRPAACQVSPLRDWAKGCKLLMLPLICFETVL